MNKNDDTGFNVENINNTEVISIGNLYSTNNDIDGPNFEPIELVDINIQCTGIKSSMDPNHNKNIVIVCVHNGNDNIINIDIYNNDRVLTFGTFDCVYYYDNDNTVTTKRVEPMMKNQQKNQ